MAVLGEVDVVGLGELADPDVPVEAHRATLPEGGPRNWPVGPPAGGPESCAQAGVAVSANGARR
jgi:hypothetical protein